MRSTRTRTSSSAKTPTSIRSLRPRRARASTGRTTRSRHRPSTFRASPAQLRASRASCATPPLLPPFSPPADSPSGWVRPPWPKAKRHQHQRRCWIHGSRVGGETAGEVESGSAGTSAPREGGEAAPGSGEAPGAGREPGCPGGRHLGRFCGVQLMSRANASLSSPTRSSLHDQPTSRCA